jgi:D-alanine-D-alanine ligase-like ATP-grasp enzyme
MINSSYLTHSQPIPDIDENKIKILKPLNGFAGSGITIVQTKEEIKSWLLKNEKYKDWLLEDYITDPDLKNGYKFHFRILILVKVEKNKQIEVYVSNHKFYTIAKDKYKKSDWQNKNIHDTHYTPGKKTILFPDTYPDNWTRDDSNRAILDMNNIFIKIFKNQNDFYPEWNANNGFEIFGADIMFSNKKPYLLEINAKTGLKDTNLIIPGLVQIILENKKNEYFTKLI